MPRANWTALPILLFAAALVAGETLGFALCRFAGFWAWTALVALLTVCVAVGWQVSCLLHIVAFAIGLALAWRSESRRMEVDGYGKVVQEGGKPPVFVLKVEDGAVCRRNAKGRRIVSFNSSYSGLPLKVVGPLPDKTPIPQNGEIWRCAGWLSLRKNAKSRYSKRTLWATDKQPLEKIAKSNGSSAAVIYRRISDVLLHRLGKGVEWSREDSSLTGAMLLGRKDGIPYGRHSVFAAAGTIHVFAISGLHVMLIAGLLNAMLKGTGLSEKMCSACAIPLLAAYVMLTDASPSAVRAALMSSLYLAAFIFGRKPDSLAVWSISAIVIFAVSPEMLLNVGCVLSFSVMFGISLWIRWSSQFASPLDGLLRIAAVEEALGCARRRRFILSIHRKAKYVFVALGISFAAWIAGVPIAAMVFGRIAFGSLFVNVIVVPLAGLAVAFGVFGTLATFLLPPIGVLFNNLAAVCVHLMSWLSEKTVLLPFASVETMPWSWLDCVMWYMAWIALFALLARHLPRKDFIQLRKWEPRPP